MPRLFARTLACLSLFAAASAGAATYYVSDCQLGAVAGCIAGNDTNNGTSPAKAWRTTAKVQQQFATLKAGDFVRFARGGVWTDASMDPLQNLAANAAQPITLDAYTPAWGASRRPILKEARKDHAMLAFTDGGEPEPDGGYVVRNLDLRGGGTAGTGIFTSQLTGDIRLENLNIQGFQIGVYCGNSIPRVQLLNSTLTNNRNQGILWSCADSLVEGNTFDGNGFERLVLDHSIYLSGGTHQPANIVVRNNKLINNSITDGICQAVPLVVHGVVEGMTIENNLIEQAAGTAGGGCWGIVVNAAYDTPEYFKGLVVRGNRLINLGGVGIACSSCIKPLIENNVIVSESDYLVGILIPDREGGPGDAPDKGAIVRNNTIYFGATAAHSVGIALAKNGTALPGTKVRVMSNLIYFGTGSPLHQCFDLTGMRRSDFQSFNNNLCYHANGGRYSTEFEFLEDAWEKNYDLKGLAENPQLAGAPTQANGWRLPLGAGSPARDAGHADSAPQDFDGVLRSKPDIGAFEYTSALSRSAK